MDARDEQQVGDKLTAMGYSARHLPRRRYGRHAEDAGQQAPAAVAAPVTRGGISSVTVASGIPVSIKPCVSLPALARFFRTWRRWSGRDSSGTSAERYVPVIHDRRFARYLPVCKRTRRRTQTIRAYAEHPGIFPSTRQLRCGPASYRQAGVRWTRSRGLEQEARTRVLTYRLA